jgi:gamma-glutamylputrescine oxidase
MNPGSYYQATRRVELNTDPLAGDLAVDVAIVGGGISGVSAALHLAERGLSVALLEAEHIGWGASGRNGGQVLPGFGASQSVIKSLVGAETSRMLWTMSVEAVDLLHAQIQRFNIPCDPQQGYLHAAIKPRHVRELEETQEELAALEDKLAGHIHPLNYTLGLAKAARAAGAKLFTQTRVTKVEPGTTIRLHTPNGTVSASYLLLSGGAYLGGLMKSIAGYIMPAGTYIIATEPRAEIAELIPGNEAVCDLNFVLNYFRRSPDNRLLFGGRVSYSTLPPPGLAASMLRRAAQVFPQLRSAKVDYLWGGNVDITRNRAPHFGRLADNILFTQGFSGHGVALTGLAGKVAAEAIAGQAGRFDVFASIPHARFPGGRRLRVPALLLATSYFRLRDML